MFVHLSSLMTHKNIRGQNRKIKRKKQQQNVSDNLSDLSCSLIRKGVFSAFYRDLFGSFGLPCCLINDSVLHKFLADATFVNKQRKLEIEYVPLHEIVV